MSAAVKELYLTCFNDGMGPAQAMKAHANDLLIDGQPHINPRPRAVYALYGQWYKDNFGATPNPRRKGRKKDGVKKEKGFYG